VFGLIVGHPDFVSPQGRKNIMPTYRVELPESGGQTLYNGARSVVCFAADVANARLYAAAAFTGDANAAWAADAAVTDISAVAADYEGWTFTVRIPDAPTPVEVSYTGIAADAHSDVGAALAALLNADAQIAGAAYAVNTLTISAIADALGDLTVEVEAVPALGEDTIGGVWSAIVDGGIAAAALSANLAGTLPGSIYGVYGAAI
jgi:hypothetical protein